MTKFFRFADVPDRCRYSADHPALDVEDGVPPPRAAPALLRRVVLSRRIELNRCFDSTVDLVSGHCGDFY